jgi:DNA-binding transcriptional MocR family regulator
MPNGNTAAGVIATGPIVADLEAVVADAAAGDRLPSVRELMARHRAGPATVQRAIAALAARGLVEARPGRGTFVAARASVPAAAPDHSWQTVALGPRAIDADPLEALLQVPDPDMIVLSTGYLPAELQPVAALGAALARAARRPGVWDRMPAEGLAGLRAHFAAAVGGGATAGDVIVCPGGQAALGTCLRGLAAPGGAVIVEAPTYLGALLAARTQGLRPVPVPADEHGVRPDLLADALDESGARLVYLQPLHANPHGATLALERRAEVLAAVRAAGAFLIEDDAFRELSLGAPEPPPPLFHDDPDGHVVHVRSLTKPSAPSLRVSAVVARGPAAARLRAARIAEDLFVSGPLQEAALELVAAPAWRAHLRRLRKVLRERRDALAAAVEEQLRPSGDRAGARLARLPSGGINLWVRLDPGEDDRELARRAAAAGVVVYPGRPFFAAEPPAPFVRLTYAAEPPERLAEGVKRLAAVR